MGKMQMYHKFMVMISMATVSLLFIFTHLDWQKERSQSQHTIQTEISQNRSERISEHEIVLRSLVTTLKTNSTEIGNETATRNHHNKSRKMQASNSKSSKSPSTEESDKDKKSKEPRGSSKSPPSTAQQNNTELTVPDWFTKGWSRTATAGQRELFVGDRPLFPACKASGHGTAKYPFIEPKKYLHTSLNPCWYEDPAKERGLRCLPYFYVAGVAKCGTTDLYRRVRMHSQIMKGTMKEYHFWDRERFGNVELARGGEVLKVHRKPWTLKQYTDAVAGDRDLALLKDDLKYTGSSSKIFGDGSPSYLWDILNWAQLSGNQGCKEPRVVIGQHIKRAYPQAKIIIILRHPTPRLYSRFLSRLWRVSFLKGANANTFHDYVVKGVAMYRECFKRWSIRHCAYNYTLFDSAVIRLVEGMYPVFVADWLRIWPREQILFLRNEDYGQNVSAVLDTVFDFLGVEPPSDEDRAAMTEQAPVNVGTGYSTVGPMRADTVKVLDEFYQPFVDQLHLMLHDQRFLWRDVYTPSHLGFSDISKSAEAEKQQNGPGDVSTAISAAAAAAAAAANNSVSRDSGSGDKSLPSWAKLLLQFKPSSQKSSKERENHQTQTEDVPIMRIEKPPGTPIKKARYPAWWVNGWPKSSTSGLGDQFLGDQPFFAPCDSHSHHKGQYYRKIEPRKYEPSLKNPCWYKDPSSPSTVRCLPYFYIAGVAKSGTGDLYRRLTHHPDVLRGTSTGTAGRELHWWDRARFGDVYSDHLPIKADKPEGARMSFKQYTEMVIGKQGVTTLTADLNTTGKSDKIFGDLSPSYFNDVKLWPLLDGNQGCSEPRVTIGQHIHHVTPNAKIIVVVRHPTPRSYLRFLSRVPEKVLVRKAASFAFHRMVKNSVNMYRACFDRWSVRHCAYNTTLYYKDKVKLWEGMYSVFLWDWLRVFPRQQIYVIRYRDLIRDTRTVMTHLFKFLQLPPLNETSMRSLMADKWLERREEHELKKHFGSMVPETVDMLNDFYEPFVDKFAETLNDETFLWRDSDHL